MPRLAEIIKAEQGGSRQKDSECIKPDLTLRAPDAQRQKDEDNQEWNVTDQKEALQQCAELKIRGAPVKPKRHWNMSGDLVSVRMWEEYYDEI